MHHEGLKRLYDYGVQEQLFELKPLHALPDAVCEIHEYEIIDFDATKIKVTARADWLQQPKSCDALKIWFERSTLLFIEMKSFTQFKRWMAAKVRRHEHARIVHEQIVKFEVSRKLSGSLQVLGQIVEWAGSIIGYDNIYKKMIILTDIPLKEERHAEDYLDFMIFYLADETASTDELIHLSFLWHLEEFEDKPIVMDCDELERYLAG